jgi:U3 small nucleolar RNA-associated protein 18
MENISSTNITNAHTNNKPKWIDEDDQQIQISISSKNNLKKLKKTKTEDYISGVEFQERLRDQFSKMNNKSDIYKWAFDEDTLKGDEETEESTTSLNNLLKTDKTILDSNQDKANRDSSILNIKQIPNLNKESTHSSIISSLSFHPTKENLVITAGLDKKLKLYSISQNEENKSSNVQTVNTIDMPIFSSKFLNDNEVLISGRRKHFLVYNIENNKLDRCNGIGNFSQGKDIRSLEKLFVGGNNFCFGTDDGYILMFDKHNKTYRYDIKINGTVNSVCFDGNGINLYAVGDQSEVYVFDLRKYRNCVSKFNDCGNFNTTYMDVSRDNSYLATGMDLYI